MAPAPTPVPAEKSAEAEPLAVQNRNGSSVESTTIGMGYASLGMERPPVQTQPVVPEWVNKADANFSNNLDIPAFIRRRRT